MQLRSLILGGFFQKLQMYKPVVNFEHEESVIFFYHKIRGETTSQYVLIRS